MSVLLLAAVLAAQPAPGSANACPNYFRPTPAKVETLKPTKLADLPKAALIAPVMRMVQGCPVPTVVRDVAEGDGRFAKP
ncbi:hypothetical protein [Phenylobacterium sp.]|uniref:hypothetical protein n=1 Tax=Phenylobacterium sp. TaxID=1871053 RepID=UPI0027194022|nr:hypothetical protein [Phenylobacterium sp.]MDO8798916.1 hypothetical protein [Phenylobacterium sp.]